MFSPMFLAAQRFQYSDPNETMESELPVCYLKHLPESANLSTVTIVEEATGNKTAVPLERPDYCAHFSLKDRRPGLYHFQVTLSNGGDINSKSFRISQGWYYRLSLHAHLLSSYIKFMHLLRLEYFHEQHDTTT